MHQVWIRKLCQGFIPGVYKRISLQKKQKKS